MPRPPERSSFPRATPRAFALCMFRRRLNLTLSPYAARTDTTSDVRLEGVRVGSDALVAPPVRASALEPASIMRRRRSAPRRLAYAK